MKKKTGHDLTLTQMVDLVIGKTDEEEDGTNGRSGRGAVGGAITKDDDEQTKEDEGDAYEMRFCDSMVVLHPTHGCQDSTSLTRVLHELQPNTVRSPAAFAKLSYRFW